MTDAELNVIRERAEAATPGPWVNVGSDVAAPRRPTEPFSCYGNYREILDEANGCDDDLEFIAHARTDIPALLAEIERLKAGK
jgi:hypothetical protein